VSGVRRHKAEVPLRIGLAGLGSMGRNHLRVLSSRPGITLAAVADPVADVLAEAVTGRSIRGYKDPLAMISEGALDGVVIAAPTNSHVALALAAIAQGIPVLIEKPLAGTVDDALRIVHAAADRHVPVQVGHIERFNPAVRELGRLLRLGWLSTIYAIVSRRAGPFPPRIRDVGVTIDLATHDVDILSWVAGERPTRVFAELAQRKHAYHEDLLFGLLHFPSGATGMLDVNWLTPAKRRQLVVIGEEGMFELDYLTQRLTFTRADIGHPTLIAGYAPTFTGEVAELPVDNAEPLGAELDAFVAVIREGSTPIVTAVDGLWAVAIASGLLEAGASGRPVDLGTLAARLSS
jgi:UDP-N-acetylglucosamine 3-dehydrogenase